MAPGSGKEERQPGGTDVSRTGAPPPNGALISPVVSEPPVRTRSQPPAVPFPLTRRPVSRGVYERLKAGLSAALRKALTAEGAVLVVALGVGAFLRIWEINQLGLNSDEAVYAGQ